MNIEILFETIRIRYSLRKPNISEQFIFEYGIRLSLSPTTKCWEPQLLLFFLFKMSKKSMLTKTARALQNPLLFVL